MRHIYRCPLRWADMDAYGHVNNVVFLRYLEEARIDFLFRPEKDFQQGSVVARHEIDYKRQLVHRHAPVDIELWVTEIRAASFTIAYEVKDGDDVYVRASTVIVPFDFAAQRPRRITAEEREFLEEYRDDDEEEAVAA
ncbi:acyl-CoA thioester hydrolase [Streptomyces sp. SAI-208]|uniref:acyl-CoA thioesterase n=1 Tax=unclassified Streptomyces TaxID=2593676 RepID=UPI0024739099|nr:MULTISPECIES: thioesterase family protein [unclassified Streptomyces]MDH6518986.1 acyl-CoA thioester hydrolase [Streptomyces sp. SAI-090]MDH6551206.1 acyl-CoA thioester hydrolase [Streptomyces sp. SAI-041]MDH6570272.1 acyl-CoA thioester hydrolase [Streptomyces sp. SAI-117]MDH6584755.1 acyl-CoA thioester hydrolase [Streptomyces sp. SAI-133]MDH6609833.1 acyl-CoA thioester hydrolase [Streptomyces sp. SAI-208]